ncbi:hypothetical protein OSB04_003812 [Centaurea solstitialis]|uniref:Reverse transcriptase zinc-binding domain-containing protein n=1 Tax=Centaurea solstitialis TaxID=347529 RepID=A0AA38WVT6_9ASTR|nr:hypothetical protein OSB04_003812 [Centaurea solstitialis]
MWVKKNEVVVVGGSGRWMVVGKEEEGEKLKPQKTEVIEWAKVIGCSSGALPFTYLGLSVGVSMKRVNHWEKVIDKINNKLLGWKAKWISFGGRLNLVKSVLSSIPLYYFSMFHALGGPESGEGNFRVKAWVKWDKVLGSFEEGGPNIGSLRDMNWCLVGKWWWRFLNESRALWHSIIVSIYGENGGLELGVGGRCIGSSVWSSVIKIGGLLDNVGCRFSSSFEKVVGDGLSTKFWVDRWTKFPRLFQLDICKEALVADRGSVIGKEGVWSWKWRRDPRGREVSELEEFCRILESYKPNLLGAYKFAWKLTPFEGFSNRLRWEKVGGRVEGGRGEATRWVKAIPTKVNVFFWRASLDRLPCRVLLDKYGVDLDPILCPMCNRESESTSHVKK